MNETYSIRNTRTGVIMAGNLTKERAEEISDAYNAFFSKYYVISHLKVKGNSVEYRVDGDTTVYTTWAGHDE